MANFFWFSDEKWARIEPLLPVNGKGARRVDDRRVNPTLPTTAGCNPLASSRSMNPFNPLWRTFPILLRAHIRRIV